MRIPYIINRNTYKTYEPSDITIGLVNEMGRVLLSENFEKIELSPETLVQQCLRTIANHFEQFPLINDLVLCADRDFLLEILSTDLPLPLVVPIIEDEIYWKRCYTDKYGVLSQHLHRNWTWKCIYLENHMGELVEKAQPEYNDEENMEDITTLLNPYIHRLIINQLQSWKPPLTMEKDEIPDTYPTDHINLEPIFRRLINIEELEIKYGMKDVGEKFMWNMFEVSLDDAKRLGKALLDLKKLRVLCLHTSNLNASHIQIITKQLIKVTTLEELTITNCLIGDRGALCIAKLMMCHTALQKLVLMNNSIGAVGGEGFGYALMQDNCCPIKHLNLRMNPLGHAGVMGIFRALVRVQKLEELILAGCGFEDETSVRLGAVLQLQYTLKLLDVSNNWCQPGQENILDGMKINSTLQWFDLRETDISDRTLEKINRKLRKNRRGDDGEASSEEASEEATEEQERVEEEEIVEESETERGSETERAESVLDDASVADK